MGARLLDTYENLLRENAAAVGSVESAIRNVTWFLPGRFADAEIASEGLYSFLSIVSAYHDSLLSRHLDTSVSLPPRPFRESTPRPDIPPPSIHARYTKYWMDSSPVYRKASRALTTVGYLQLLIEMIAKKRGDRWRWKVLVGLEGFKTVLKLIILKITNRPVLQTCVPTREFDPTVLSTEQLKPGIASMPAGSPLHNHLLPLLPSLPPSHQVHPLSLLPELRRSTDQLAEIIASTSTFIYLLLLLRAQRNRPVRHRPLSLPTLSSSLSPFLITFMLQLLARRLRSRPTTELQAAHYGQLDRALASWLVKGPLWVGWTRPKIMRVVGALERIPILGLVGGFIGDYVPLVDDYFYYTCS